MSRLRPAGLVRIQLAPPTLTTRPTTRMARPDGDGPEPADGSGAAAPSARRRRPPASPSGAGGVAAVAGGSRDRERGPHAHAVVLGDVAHQGVVARRVMSLTVKVRVSPGFRFGSPVSPTLLASSTLSAPVVTGAGGSPPSATGACRRSGRRSSLQHDHLVVDGAGVLHHEGDVAGRDGARAWPSWSWARSGPWCRSPSTCDDGAGGRGGGDRHATAAASRSSSWSCWNSRPRRRRAPSPGPRG